MKIYQVQKKYPPISATDSKGNDVLSVISKKDDKYLSDFSTDKYQGTAEVHDLILDPGKAGFSGKLLVFLTGWVFPTDASINVALMQSDQFKAIPPVIQVLNKKGEWETVVDNVGFPMGKDKTVVVDLTGKFLSKDHRIRIRTSMEVYWDQIFFSEDNPEVPFTFTDLTPAKADLHYRGFSRLYRKGGRYGPHWFDYSSVDKNRKWHDLTGNYTRFGDVLPLLKRSDNQYIISNSGDETTVEYDAKNLPELKKGWQRDFLIHSVGWVKDGDLNTATGNTVLPLPFHGMKSYPPAANDAYPNTPELQQYNRIYNTRSVKAEDYHNVLVTK
jgi:hypothetical protein